MVKCIQNESSAYIGIGKLSVQLATIASIEIIVCFFSHDSLFSLCISKTGVKRCPSLNIFSPCINCLHSFV